jgi:RNA polymerase sigma factor (sigma-70 family)
VATARRRVVAGQLRTLYELGAIGDLSDRQLLERFNSGEADHAELAFAALVERHGPMVLRVCSALLRNPHDAQDAFQATFLVLARKASALDPRRPLAGWLYLVAYHLALRLRAVAARRRRCETRAACHRPAHDANAAAANLEKQEVHHVLREELDRLPERIRAPLVLCYLQGQTHAEAARTIGMPRGSIAKRIGEGLEQLRQRLTHRGITI